MWVVKNIYNCNTLPGYAYIFWKFLKHYLTKFRDSFVFNLKRFTLILPIFKKFFCPLIASYLVNYFLSYHAFLILWKLKSQNREKKNIERTLISRKFKKNNVLIFISFLRFKNMYGFFWELEWLLQGKSWYYNELFYNSLFIFHIILEVSKCLNFLIK